MPARVIPSFLHPATEGIGMNAENLGRSLGSLDDAVGLGQYGQDVALGYVVQRRACAAQRWGRILQCVWPRRLRPASEVKFGIQNEHRAIGQDHRSLDDVLQFANVPRPMVIHETLHSLRWDAIYLLAKFLIKFGEKEHD